MKSNQVLIFTQNSIDEGLLYNYRILDGAWYVMVFIVEKEQNVSSSNPWQSILLFTNTPMKDMNRLNLLPAMGK